VRHNHHERWLWRLHLWPDRHRCRSGSREQSERQVRSDSHDLDDGAQLLFSSGQRQDLDRRRLWDDLFLLGAYDFIIKIVDLQLVEPVINRALEHLALRRQVAGIAKG
jgi:hypothetical protein